MMLLPAPISGKSTIGAAWKSGLIFGFVCFSLFSSLSSVKDHQMFVVSEQVVDTHDGSQSSQAMECPLGPCHLSIVFMGDSLTRFMYYSLVYFLRHNNTWIDPTTTPNLVRPGDFQKGSTFKFNWMAWYHASTSALAPYENCDCYREDTAIQAGTVGGEWIQENRYFYDPVRNNTITYFQSFGSGIPIRGHWLDPNGSSRQQRQQQARGVNQTGQNNDTTLLIGPINDRVPYAWSGNWSHAIRNQISQLKPNALIMNAGKWEHDFGREETRNDLRAAIQDVGIPNPIWKTTTSNVHGVYSQQEKIIDTAMCELLGQCLDVSGWTARLPRRFYLDKKHFAEPVYRKMNEELLEHLNISWSGHRLNFVQLKNEWTFERNDKDDSNITT